MVCPPHIRGSHRLLCQQTEQGNLLMAVLYFSVIWVLKYILYNDRHRNPNINIREIIWLGNQLDGLVKMKIVDLDNGSPGEGVDPPEHENPEGGGDHHREQDVRSLRLSVFISAQAGNRGCLSIMV